MAINSIPEGRELLDPKGAADYLGLKVSSLADMRVRGAGPQFCKAGRAVRYRLADLDKWLAGRTYQSTSEAKGA